MLEVYPIGKAHYPPELDLGSVMTAIDAIEKLPDELAEALEGCGDLDHPIREGVWSIRALAHHLADSHMNAYIRTKLALTEEAPAVKAYDEVAWSALADSRLPVEGAVSLLRLLHERWVEVLRSMGPAELNRTWVAPGTVDPRPAWRIPLSYAWHGEHHVAQIVQARAHFHL
jgi:hypothetical protein